MPRFIEIRGRYDHESEEESSPLIIQACKIRMVDDIGGCRIFFYAPDDESESGETLECFHSLDSYAEVRAMLLGEAARKEPKQ